MRMFVVININTHMAARNTLATTNIPMCIRTSILKNISTNIHATVMTMSIKMIMILIGTAIMAMKKHLIKTTMIKSS
jgi:hypothetical protein